MAWDGGAFEPWDGSVESRRLQKMLTRAERECDDGAAVAFLFAHRLLRRKSMGLADLLKPRHELSTDVGDATYRRLSKVLSLTASDTEGEAIAAFLMARRLIRRLGLRLGDVITLPADAEADRASGADPQAGFEQCYPTLEVEVMALRKRVRELGAELAASRRALKRYESAFDAMVDTAWTQHHGPHAGGPALLEQGTVPH
jgi:hypothetical protein